MTPLLLPAVLAVGLCAPTPAAAEVKMEEGAHGRVVISNETPVQRSRRLAPRMVPVPSETLLELIALEALRHEVDPVLVRAVMQAESGYNVRALSRVGAQGLMQLMPATARELAVEDPFDPADNIRGGVRYLRQMIDRFGRVELALAAYNAGPGAVERHRGIPPYAETVEYVDRVIALWRDGGGDVPRGLSVRPRGVLEGESPRWTRGRERILLTNDDTPPIPPTR
jgi:soluble lytic murein transglycosylase